ELARVDVGVDVPGEELEVPDEARGRQAEVRVQAVHLAVPLVRDHRARGRPPVRGEDHALLRDDPYGGRARLDLLGGFRHQNAPSKSVKMTTEGNGCLYLRVDGFILEIGRAHV